MKKSRLFILLGILAVIAAAVVWYLLWDRDLDRISPLVEVRSCRDRLLAEVRNRTGNEFSSLSEEVKISTLAGIAHNGDEDLAPAAVRLLADFSGTEQGKRAILACLEDSAYAVVAEALTAIERNKISSAKETVAKKAASLAQMADAAIPLSDVEYLAATGHLREGDIQFDFEEKQTPAQPIDDSRAYEINLFLPRGGEYYLSFPNFDNRWEEFQSSRFMTAFRKQPAYEDLEGFGPLEELYKLKSLVDQRLGSFSRFFTPEKLFRDDLKVARYPEGKLFVTFKGKNSELAEALTSILPEAGKGRYRISQRQSQGRTVREIAIRGGRRLCFATAGDYFLLSDSPVLLDRSLETFFTAREKSIGAYPPFQQAYKALDLRDKNTFCFLFFDPARAAGFGESRTRSRFLLKLARHVLATIDGAQLGAAAGDNGADTMSICRAIPESSLALLVGEDFDPHLFWDYLRRNRAASAESIDSLERGSHLRFGEEIVGKFERGAFLSYAGIRYGADHQSNVSVMKSVLGISSSRPAELAQPLARLFAYLFRNPPAELPYGGWKIQVCSDLRPADEQVESTPAPDPRKDEPISPCFVLLDRGVLFSMNAAVLKEHIDAYRGSIPSAFPNGFSGEKVSEKIQIRTAPVLRNAYSFLSRYARRTTRFTDQEIRERIQPFFNLLESNLSIHGWSKEYAGIYHGQITLDMK